MTKVLYVSSEAFPLVKTGGLGDVAGSLTAALLRKSQDVRLFLPAYPEVLQKIRHSKVLATGAYYNLDFEIIETRLPGSNVIVWLMNCPAAFNRTGGPYTDEKGQPWQDNALRFAVFCHAAVDISLNKLKLEWQPDIVHCNDWQSGLVPALLSLHSERPVTIFTIHNLAYQGIFDSQTFVDLQLAEELWHIDGLEFFGQLSFIKGGIVYADEVTTVSPGYAREILSPEFGFGLDGLLKTRVNHLSGILNGIDDKLWNPGTDNCLKQKYNRRSLNKKSLNKTGMQEDFSLPVDATTLMIGMVGRLVEQKGLNIILQSLPLLLSLPVQIVILGTGESHFENQLSEAAETHSDRMKVIIGYDESIAHRIEAASDIYLMPSTFEPCGLNQLYSLRYGTLPVVTHVGGLADTVTNASADNIENGTANGFVLQDHTAKSLLAAVQQALFLFRQPAIWRRLQMNAMNDNFTWQTSADNYINLYQKALNRLN